VLRKFLLIIFTLLLVDDCFAQPMCQASPTANCMGSFIPTPSMPENHDFVFDDFKKFLNGITYSAATTLKLNIAGPACRWKLHIYIDNIGSVNPDEWILNNAYGAGTAPIPDLDILDIRITNECNTPIPVGFNSIPDRTQMIAVIDNNFAPDANAGDCNTNVNGQGDFLSNYREFHFKIDYKVTPGLNTRPGNYQVVVRYCLTEDI